MTPQQTYDLLDSMVKIGLGAIIGAAGTIVGLLLTHRHDSKKEFRRRKADALERILEEFEAIHVVALSICLEFNAWARATADRSPSAEIHYKNLAVVDDLPAMLKKVLVLSGRLNLIGLPESAKDLRDYTAALGDLLNVVKFSNPPSEEVVLGRGTRISNIEEAFVLRLSKHYCR